MFFYSPKSTASTTSRPSIVVQQTQIHDQRLNVQLARTMIRRKSVIGRSASTVSAGNVRGARPTSASLDTSQLCSNEALAALDSAVTPPDSIIIDVPTNMLPASCCGTIGTILRSTSLRRSLLRPQITISHSSNENLPDNTVPDHETDAVFGGNEYCQKPETADQNAAYVYNSCENCGYIINEKLNFYRCNNNVENNNDCNLSIHGWDKRQSCCWSGSNFSAPPLITPTILTSSTSRQCTSKGGTLLWPLPPTGNTSITATLQQKRGTGLTTTLVLRRPTITIQEDGIVLIDHLAARWDGLPGCAGNGALLSDDNTTLSDTSKNKKGNCLQRHVNQCLGKTLKFVKILTPHVILVSVLIGYLCFGAWILMLLETKTELMARSRKLIRLSNLMTNFTAESWKQLNSAQTGERPHFTEQEWTQAFREYMLRVSETIDDRRPIRRELRAPDLLLNLHNKWTFPTALLYVLTVLTTCGYGEVSVDTDTGKMFSVAFALVGIPLMFITAADIGKFLSETLLRLVKNWNAFIRYVKKFFAQLFCNHKKFERRKSLQSAAGHQFETLGLLGTGLEGTGTEENLWFPIGAYVSCICLYCSMGSAMFIHWESHWSFVHAFHFGFNLIVTVGLGDIVVTDYVFLSLIVAFVIVGLSVVTMCVDLASTHLKAYFTRIHYFGRARRFLELSDDLREIVALFGAMRKKKHGKVSE